MKSSSWHQTAPTTLAPPARTRRELRTAISGDPTARRNWVQFSLLLFCLSGLATNVAATGTAVRAGLTAPGKAPLIWTVFLFFWLLAQLVIWVSGMLALARLGTGKALTLPEALGDIYRRPVR